MDTYYVVLEAEPGRRYGRRHYLAAVTVDGAVAEAGAGRTVYRVGAVGEWDEPVGDDHADAGDDGLICQGSQLALAVGDLVETVGLSPEDSDTGRVACILPLTVAWDSGVVTPATATDLRRV